MKVFLTRLGPFTAATFLILGGCAQVAGPISPGLSNARNGYAVPPALNQRNTASSEPSMRVASLDHSVNGLYVTESNGGVVLAYNKPFKKNPKPICSLSVPVPVDVASDSSGNVYVASDTTRGQPGTLLVYAPDCGGQTANVSDPYGQPLAIALKGSTWYVGNVYGLSLSAPNIAVCTYSGCSSDLTATGSNAMGELWGVAVDKNGNVYADAYPEDSGSPIILEWRKGKNPGRTIYTFPTTDFEAGGALAFDRDGNLVVGGDSEFFVLSGCPTACAPNGPFALLNSPSPHFKLNKSGSVFVPNEGGSDEAASVDVYAYHGINGAKYEYSITKGLSSSDHPYGIAVLPPSTP